MGMLPIRKLAIIIRQANSDPKTVHKMLSDMVAQLSLVDSKWQELEILSKSFGHELIRTRDGSWTLRSQSLGEACHSLAGAISETIEVYLVGSGLFDFIKEGAPPQVKPSPLRVLEVGFGCGWGWWLTQWWMKWAAPFQRLQFVSLEKESELIEFSHRTQMGVVHSCDQRQLEIVLGDAQHSLATMNFDPFHVIYQDAFSPKNNPELWSESWFTQLDQVSQAGTVLSTYSAQSATQKILKKLGWEVHKFAGFAGKRERIFAVKN